MTFDAKTASLTTTVVTLKSPSGDPVAVDGRLAVGEWAVTDSVGVDEDDDRSRAVTVLRVDDSNAAIVGTDYTIPESSRASSFTITHAALSSTASVPTVTYTVASGSETGALADADDLVVGQDSAVASDGVSPTFGRLDLYSGRHIHRRGGLF